ncbi:hypothetical protein MMC07_001328 [Pseudocyphellaria aurata]|nr:hypothetical protein [Pseudocyphellaria aurata]
MANPVNQSAHAFDLLCPSSPQAFRNRSHVGHPDFACHRCVDYVNAIADLRVHVTMLEVQLMKAERKRSEAERRVFHFVGCNEATISQVTAPDPNPDESNLRRQLFQANSEKDCMKIMLERAWKKIADLSVSATSDSESRLSPARTALKDAEDLLLDLVGPKELPKTGDCKGIDELNEVGETKFITNPDDGEKVAITVQEEVTPEPEDLSENSYIFRFVREHTNSNDPGNEDEAIMMNEKASNRSSGSDSLTEVNSATSSPIIENGNIAEVPSMQSSIPEWPSKAAPNWIYDTPTQTTGPMHAVEFKHLHKLVNDAKTTMNYHVQLYESRQELDDAIRHHKQYEGREMKRLPEFFHHGLQFNPPSESRNVFRTLLISNLPQSATMTKLLEKVRGGVVVDAKLLDTFSITGGKTALVTFSDQGAAKALRVYLEQHPITMSKRVAHVMVLKTPTWPMSGVCQKVIFDGGGTRCLEVSKYPRHVSPIDLRRHLCLCSVTTLDRIECMNLGKDGVLSLRFESTASAIAARDVFDSHWAFRGCVVQYAPDPCAQPLKVTK